MSLVRLTLSLILPGRALGPMEGRLRVRCVRMELVINLQQ